MLGFFRPGLAGNAEGLAFVPGTNELWAAVNETDDILYPFRNSWQGSGINRLREIDHLLH
jgi:hypothetical protein